MILAAFSSLLILMHTDAYDNTVVIFVVVVVVKKIQVFAIGFFGPVNFHN